jgi:hypothetical protein
MSPVGLLRLCHERPCGRRAEQRDELAALHGLPSARGLRITSYHIVVARMPRLCITANSAADVADGQCLSLIVAAACLPHRYIY